MAPHAAQVKVALAERGRRKDLRVFADPLALDFGAPGEFSVAGLDRVQVLALSVHHLAVSVHRARALISPRADNGADAYVLIGHGKLRGRWRAGEPDRRVKFDSLVGGYRHSAAFILFQVIGLSPGQHHAVALFASFEFESLQPLITLAVLSLLARDHDVAAGYERRARAPILFLPNDRACRSV